MEFVANFTLNNDSLDAVFDINEVENFDALFQINASPEKVSQLINDLNFQTDEQVQASIETASDIINDRIDGVVETFNEELDTKVTGVQATGVIEATRVDNIVTLKSVSFIFEQAIASSEWVIIHNLNKKPSIYIVDSLERVQIPNEIIYDSPNQITVTFLAAFAGRAYLN